MKKIFKTTLALILSIVTAAGTFCTTTTPVLAATPSFGFMASGCTLYGNVYGKESMKINVIINNYSDAYNYKMYSTDADVCSYSNAIIKPSVACISFTLQAGECGTAVINLAIFNKSGKLIQEKKMKVTVTTKGMSVPTSLRRVSATANTAKFNFKNATTTYVTGYKIQVSTKSNFSTTVINKVIGNKNTVNINVSGLKKNTTYYARVAAVSKNGNNNKTYRSGWSNTIKFTTPKL